MAEAAQTKKRSPESPHVSKSQSRHTFWFLLAFYGFAVVWGVRNVWFWKPSDLDWVVPIALAIVLGWWAIVDSRRRGQPIPLLARPWFFLSGGLLVPGYVLWSRGWRGAGWLVLHCVLWYVLATLSMHAGGIIVFGDEWLRGLTL